MPSTSPRGLARLAFGGDYNPEQWPESVWQEDTYGSVEAVNEAWGTAFWGQRYTDLAQINPPRATPTVGNPGQALDYKRFADATMRENFVMERDILHRLSPG